MGRPRKRQTPTPTAEATETEARKKPRSGPVRTPQNPFEASQVAVEESDEPLYAVESVEGLRWVKGERQYLVSWVGYDEADRTWESMSNLVGCAEQIRDFEKRREAQDLQEKELFVAKRKAAKEKAEAEAKRLREQSIKDAAGADGDVGVLDAEDAGGESVMADGNLKMHKSKVGSVWRCFDLTKVKPTCKCLAPTGLICGVEPSSTGGTSNYWSHLWTHHKQEWYKLKSDDGKLNAAGKAELETLEKTIDKMKGSASYVHSAGGEFLSAKLPPKAKECMDRVTAEWIIDEDQCFNAASAPAFRRMMATASNGLYDGCGERNVKQHIYAMAVEGKAAATAFHKSLLESGLKPAASGDLWSKNGTALFGLVSHGIVRTAEDAGKVKWTMHELLAGAVPCSQERHTGKYICEVSNDAWSATGITKPIEEIFLRVSDNGANMLKGWEHGFQTPCCDHTMELSVKLYNEHKDISPTLEKGRGTVGYLNSSVVGCNEQETGLHKCQESAGLPTCRLTQDVKTRWRSTHDMCESLRINQEPLILYDVRNPTAAEGFKKNRYSLEDWTINAQTVALLSPLAEASQYLEGKKYPTINLVLPSIYSCIEHMKPDNPVRQPWDGRMLAPDDLRPEVKAARKVLYDDLVARWKTDMSESMLRFYMTATLLDPRQRKLAFPGINAVDRHVAYEWLTAEFDSLWSDKPTEPKNTATVPATPLDAASEKKGGASFLHFMSSLSHLQPPAAATGGTSDSNAPTSKSEVELYLDSEESVPMVVDILEWWASKEKLYPNLSKMARQYLGCPATSASAERLFSVAGRVYDDLRQNMEDAMLENVMWARINRSYKASSSWSETKA